MSRFGPRAVLFDLDGTLVDSEPATDSAIAAVMARHGIGGVSLPPDQTHGRTWRDIVSTLQRAHAISISAADLEAELEEVWIDHARSAPPIPGAAEAIRRAKDRFALAVVSSSARRVIDSFLSRLGVEGAIDPTARIGAESVKRSKPDPEGYLLAAERLGVLPSECVVFEDSSAGLSAAKAAGMRSVFIAHRTDEPTCAALANAVCRDYEALPPDFWNRLADGALELDGAVF